MPARSSAPPHKLKLSLGRPITRIVLMCLWPFVWLVLISFVYYPWSTYLKKQQDDAVERTVHDPAAGRQYLNALKGYTVIHAILTLISLLFLVTGFAIIRFLTRAKEKETAEVASPINRGAWRLCCVLTIALVVVGAFSWWWVESCKPKPLKHRRFTLDHGSAEIIRDRPRVLELNEMILAIFVFAAIAVWAFRAGVLWVIRGFLGANEEAEMRAITSPDPEIENGEFTAGPQNAEKQQPDSVQGLGIWEMERPVRAAEAHQQEDARPHKKESASREKQKTQDNFFRRANQLIKEREYEQFLYLVSRAEKTGFTDHNIEKLATEIRRKVSKADEILETMPGDILRTDPKAAIKRVEAALNICPHHRRSEIILAEARQQIKTAEQHITEQFQVCKEKRGRAGSLKQGDYTALKLIYDQLLRDCELLRINPAWLDQMEKILERDRRFRHREIAAYRESEKQLRFVYLAWLFMPIPIFSIVVLGPVR